MTTAFDPAACGDRFAAFFRAVHGNDPFPWQRRLAVRACDPARGWPDAIALPTAAGKTSAIDVAVFALAYRAELGHPRTTPRRIFFVVDRRIVVDQAYLHAKELSDKLAAAKSGVLAEVAATLKTIGEGDRPLDVYALRGGMYREDTWVRSPLQPTVITSTVDQVGSRLLFRGYGVTESMAPVHAGLVGNDALILLDEAHCSRPFAETAAAVKDYRRWNPDLAPFAFVQMTATPAGGVLEAEEKRKRDHPDEPPLIEADEADDRAHPFLGKRISAAKPTKLVVTADAKKKDWRTPLVKALADEARGLMGQRKSEPDEVRAVGVIVNRVATARELAAVLEDDAADVLLLTGRMRPLDRDRLLDRLRPLFTGNAGPARPTFVVATQCLEVGADLDFHGLVTECASLDALRQRFGRLNRHAQTRTHAPGVVVIRADQQELGSEDTFPYDDALPGTWKWLLDRAVDATVDFGVAAMRAATDGVDLGPLNAPAPAAPVLLPAHLDCWVQTAPRPEPDPDPALFLHGPKSGPPDVQVVFRADLPADPDKWAAAVALCPPSSSEAIPVRIGDFKRWVAAENDPKDLNAIADVEGVPDDREEPEPAVPRPALRWAGPDKSGLLTDAKEVRPNATYVVPVIADGIAALGDFPAEGRVGGVPVDYGDAAFQRSRDRAVLRLTPGVVGQWPERFRTPAVLALAARPADAEDDDTLPDIISEALRELEAVPAGPDSWATPPEAASWGWLPDAVKALLPEPGRGRTRPPDAEAHPAGGVVLTGRRRLHRFDPTFGDDESSESPVRRQVTLDAHTRGVMGFAARFAAGAGLPDDDRGRFALAARWHDLGKADPRFQAMLLEMSPRAAAGQRDLYAKSGSGSRTPKQLADARTVHLWPRGGRHELLSAAFATERTDDDTTLHLIGTHHGGGRPFAAPYVDGTLDRVRDLVPPSVELLGESFAWPSEAGGPTTANAVGPDRFWRVVRARGWWGSAYLESLFRLADQLASQTEQERSWNPPAAPDAPPPPPPATRPALRPLPLTGLDGSNPLGFLAAVGALRLAEQCYPAACRMRWERRNGWTPILEMPGEVTDDVLIEQFHTAVHGVADPAAQETSDAAHKSYRSLLKTAQKARKALSAQKLRGAERAAAMAADVEPLEAEADSLRAVWLAALLKAAPAPFLSLGKALAVTAEEYREFVVRVRDGLRQGSTRRQDVDFAAAFGSEVCFDSKTGRITPTEFQLITGSGHQFFLDTLASLMESVTPDQLRRALFGPWSYRDPRLSFRWNPGDDRRYAYGWGDPAGETVLTEHGANLLAAYGLPLFPVAPTHRGAATTGFDRDADPPTFTWPIWSDNRSCDAARSLLALPALHRADVDRTSLRLHGVTDAYRVRKIEVGRPPLSKLNLTPAVTA